VPSRAIRGHPVARLEDVRATVNAGASAAVRRLNGFEPGHERGAVAEQRHAHAAVILAFAFTPLGGVWFTQVAALQPALVSLAVVGLIIAVPLPGLSTFQSWYQGAVVHGRRTRAITESMVVYVVVIAAVLAIGVVTQRFAGLPVAIAAMVLGNIAQVVYLRLQAHSAIRAIQAAA